MKEDYIMRQCPDCGEELSYDSEFDLYDLELVLVLDQVYLDVYALYYPSEVEDQILAMIDSISL